MNRALLAGVSTIMALAVAGPAFAQARQLALEERAKIKQYVLTAIGDPVTIIERPMIGARLPASVPLNPVPTNWGRSAAKYNYVLTPVPTDWTPSSGTTYRVLKENNQVVLVEPSTREVVEIIK